MSTNSINWCVKQLEEQARQTLNDRDYPELVKYINCFLTHFGKERVYLAGSTAEHLKVTTNKDGGDADIILLSGKLEIPAENIEFRNDTPCFVRIKVDKARISKTIRLIDGNYLPSDVLRSVGPELFTLLRCIYLLIICGVSYSPSNTINTTFTNSSKVGLAMSLYRFLKVEEGMSSIARRYLPKRQFKTHNESFKAYIKRRQSKNELYKQDFDIVERVIECMSYMKIQGKTDGNRLMNLEKKGESKLMILEHFAYLFNRLQERLNEASLEESLGEDDDSDVKESAVPFENDIESASENQTLPDSTNVPNESMALETSERKIRATCTRIRHIDIVPALKLIGGLECMETWKTAQHLWLSQGEIDVIAKMDVFCVAKYAPVNPSRKDFCLSFTLAEKKLTECLSPVQRPLVLIMKAFLKGIFTKRHTQRDRVLQLTTFHVKTVIYKVSDVTEPSLWSEVNVAANLERVLAYLNEALRKKELMHYFMPSNLFAGFEDVDFKILLACTDEVMSDPVGGLQAFFELYDGKPIELCLTEEELANMERSTTDDGISDVVDILEESMVELLRGLKESPRDEQGNTPIMEAFRALLKLLVRQVPQVLADTGISTGMIEDWVLSSFEKILKPGGFKSEEDKRLTFQLIKTIVGENVSR